MLADMKTDLGHRGGAGYGTLPLGSLIFNFLSNFVPAARQPSLEVWLHTCKNEDGS